MKKIIKLKLVIATVNGQNFCHQFAGIPLKKFWNGLWIVITNCFKLDTTTNVFRNL